MIEDFGCPPARRDFPHRRRGPTRGAGRLNVLAVGVIGFVAAVVGDNIGFAIGITAAARWSCAEAATCASPGNGWTRPTFSSNGTAPGSSPSVPPRDRDEALWVLRAAVVAGVDHIDTAQYYGAPAP